MSSDRFEPKVYEVKVVYSLRDLWWVATFEYGDLLASSVGEDGPEEALQNLFFYLAGRFSKQGLQDK